MVGFLLISELFKLSFIFIFLNCMQVNEKIFHIQAIFIHKQFIQTDFRVIEKRFTFLSVTTSVIHSSGRICFFCLYIQIIITDYFLTIVF